MGLHQVATLCPEFHRSTSQSKACLSLLWPFPDHRQSWNYGLQAEAAGFIFHPPVFHVSQLKVAALVTHIAQPLPSSLDGLQVPERVLQERVAKVGADVRLEALIQWSGMPSSLATWEDMETLRQRFPRAPTWGQAGSYQGC